VKNVFNVVYYYYVFVFFFTFPNVLNDVRKINNININKFQQFLIDIVNNDYSSLMRFQSLSLLVRHGIFRVT